VRLPRTAAVKDGPFLRPPEGLVHDEPEHGGRLVSVGIALRSPVAAFTICHPSAVATIPRIPSAERYKWVADAAKLHRRRPVAH